MRKAVFKSIFLALTVAMAIGLTIGLSACNAWLNNQLGTSDTTTPNNPNNQEITAPNDSGMNQDKLIFRTMRIDGNNVYGEVSSNTETFSFLDEIIVSGNANYSVSLDIYGSIPVTTKTVALYTGDNTFYVFATVNGQSKLYTVNIRRKSTYLVTFETYGGVTIPSQIVEEGGYAVAPKDATKAGYTFKGWTYDFSKPVTSNVVVTALWSANSYTIKYDPDDDGVMNTLNVTYNTYYTLQTPERTGYTFKGWYSGNTKYEGGVWNKTSNVTLTAKWDINSYDVTTSVNLTDVGRIYGAGNYKYNSTVTVKADTEKLGYTWIGWYDETNRLLSTDESYDFTLGARNIKLEARWEISDEMSDFVFTSTAYSCTIKDVNNHYKETYTIPNYVTSIGGAAFKNCTQLTSITIPNSVTLINLEAFSGCTSLQSIVIPDSIDSIESYTFHNCINLTSVTIPNSVTYIWGDAFYGCRSLENIVIPNSVISIGSNAFYNCNKLTSITIPESVTKIYSNAFRGCDRLVEVYNLSPLTITAGSDDNGCVGKYALKIYTTANEENHLWTDEDGFVFYENGDTCYLLDYIGSNTVLTLPADCNGKIYGIYNGAFKSNSSLKSIIISNGVTSIGAYAFSNCSALTSVFFDENSQIVSIGSNAFYQCDSLNSITLPDSVMHIGDHAFYDCDGLTSITIPDSVTSLGKWAFAHSIALKTVTLSNNLTSIGNHAFYGCSKLISIAVPDGITCLESSVFGWCTSLLNITIPDSVTIISDDAFYNCKELTSITFIGTKAQWSAISKHSNWKNLSAISKAVCSDGTINC